MGGWAHWWGRLGLFNLQCDKMSFFLYLSYGTVCSCHFDLLHSSHLYEYEEYIWWKVSCLAQRELLDCYRERTSLCACVRERERETQLSLSAAVSFTCRRRVSRTPTLPSASLGCILIPRESVSSFSFFHCCERPLRSRENAPMHLTTSAVATAHSVSHKGSSLYLMFLCIRIWLWLQVHHISTSWNRCGSVHGLGIWRFDAQTRVRARSPYPSSLFFHVCSEQNL